MRSLASRIASRVHHFAIRSRIGLRARCVWSCDPDISTASTPPPEWYTSAHYYVKDRDSVLQQGWQLADVQPIKPGTFKTGAIGDVEYLLTCDEAGTLRAFHNVCSHHAAIVAQGEGSCQADSRFRCPYHGWTYDVKGRLVEAPRLKGIRDFAARNYGLKGIDVERWGRFTFLRLGGSAETTTSLGEFIGEGALQELDAAGLHDQELVHVERRTYAGIRCNWKVFCDNYLDGGYHVPIAHPDLAAGLSLSDYSSRCYAGGSVQGCQPQADARLGNRRVAYAFVFPNVMINRYGPWLDVNVVRPTSAETCDVVFDWWVHASRAGDAEFVRSSLAASDQVQREDIALCESVQRGLRSPGCRAGRYAPAHETPMHHFHRWLHERYTAHANRATTGSRSGQGAAACGPESC